jgi:DNA-binding MarR family transcriptional regulator
VKDENYINIQGWMINRLKLSGNKLIIYAAIYGFSQDENSKYAGSAGYLAECAGISRQAVMEIVKSLAKDGLLIKTTRMENGVKYCDYFAVIPCQETLQGGVKKVDTPCQETLHHIDLDIKRDNKKDKESGFVFLDAKNPPESKPVETKEDAVTVWNKAREFWNEKGLKPICRDLIMRAGDTGEILRTFQSYSWMEIENAIGNYAWHKFKAGSDFRPPPPYGSLAGFLKTGVEKYFDDDSLDQQFKEARQ